MHHRTIGAVLAILLVLISAAPTPGAEDWADPNLKMTAGLEVWLDAARLREGQRAAKVRAAAPGRAVETWYDASGHGRHLLQKDPAARPTFEEHDGHVSLRFDGTKQFLSAAGLDRSYKAVTVFLITVPFDNAGGFRGFLSMNQTGKNDYLTGLTIDQGADPAPLFRAVNVEGAGFGGAGSLMRERTGMGRAFGTVSRLCVTTAVGAGGTKLYLNGTFVGERDRADSTLRMDQLTVGARYFNNDGPPAVRSFLEGDIFEVLVYDRVLSDAERTQVEKYLTAKHGNLRKVPVPPRSNEGKRLVAVADMPPVQVFVPGFTVRQLPLDLTNINNLQYRPDGKLVALAYDGNVYVLSDTDGDGLEDKAELFWDNKGRIRSAIGMALTPPGYKHGTGVFVACKGKCSLFVDSKGGGVADKEIVVADGWPDYPHGVDAVGIAIDPRDGSVYFGLGTASFTGAYQIDKEGKAHYSLKNERGTILRVAPDFKSREILCTGIRYSVGLRFNRQGDLFCADQEGATWLPNGNPLDELLHIEKGRHYGFPPRHPKHLPGVIDEPSVFDWGPQHQSICGINFNEPVNGGPSAGPAWWHSDLFAAGYSRGKLYRTKLVKTATGYVGQNQLLASLNMLPADVCVSPQGDLVVAVHSGGPDWGSGPTGKGKLYKISYTGKELPQPVLAWPQGPREVRVAFDRPLDADQLRHLTGKVGIDYGKYVAAGDRFEFHRPGYQVVRDQLQTPRFDLPVVGVQVTSDRRTIILATAPHPEAAGYALMLPGLGRPAIADEKRKELAQVPETDLRYDLCGIEAAWQPKGGATPWTGWLPHLDLDVSRPLTTASAPHDELWQHVRQPGTLTLRTKLDLVDMLRPAVQPGSKIDYEWPAEEVTVVFRSTAAFEVRGTGKLTPPTTDKEGRRVIQLTVKPTADSPVPIEVILPTGSGDAQLSVSYHTQEDARPRALQTHRFLLPWAALKKTATPTTTYRDIPELKGGNWARGRDVFFSDQAACSRCHAVGGHGAAIGPDLSNLPHRDYHSVLRDITEPNFAINPDYITHLVALEDGRMLSGSIRTQGERLQIGDLQGKVTEIRRDQVAFMHTAGLSVMPEGMPKQLGADKMKDLLVFLLADPPRMPEYGKATPPPPRDMQEVKAVLAGAPDPPAKTRPIHVVLVAGKKDHGPGEHDYPAWLKVWEQLLALAPDIKVTTAMDWPAAEDLKTADVLVFNQQGKWTPERAKDIDAYLARGGGLVYVHFAVDGGTDAPGFAQRIGLAWRGQQSKYRHGALELGFDTGGKHPIARNFDKVKFHDESYWNLVGDVKKVNVLASGVEDGQPQPLFWTLEPSKGRVFVSIPGHFSWTFDDPLFRVLLLRGIAWTAREPVDRFNALVTPGARIKP